MAIRDIPKYKTFKFTFPGLNKVILVDVNCWVTLNCLKSKFSSLLKLDLTAKVLKFKYGDQEMEPLHSVFDNMSLLKLSTNSSEVLEVKVEIGSPAISLF